MHDMCASHDLKVFSCGKLDPWFTQSNAPSLGATDQVSVGSHLLTLEEGQWEQSGEGG